MDNVICTAEGCVKPKLVKGAFCAMHKSRMTRHGVLELPTTSVCLHCECVFALKGVRRTMFCSTHCRNAAYWASNKEVLTVANRSWRQLHGREDDAKRRAQRLANPEKYHASELAARQKNRSVINARAAVYRANNRDRVNATVRLWGKANLEKKLAYNRARRARKHGNGSFVVTQQDLIRLLRRFNNCCAYCAVNLGGDTTLHLDHIIPIARGGAHSIGNLTPACSGCNLSKRDKTVMEWRLWKSRLPALTVL